MGGVLKVVGVVGTLALGCVTPRAAMGAQERGGAKPSAERICPTSVRAGVVVCFGDRGLTPEQQRAVDLDVRKLFVDLAGDKLHLSGGQQLLVRIDGVQPNFVFHVEPVGEDGATLAGWEKEFAECERDVGCTAEDWHGIVSEAMRQALTDLRRPTEPGSSSEPPRYLPGRLGIAGIVTASVGGLGMLTGTGLIIVGALPGNPAPGLRQDRNLLPLSRDFYTPGAVTLGASVAVAAAGIAMVVVDLRRWKVQQGSVSALGPRKRLQLTVSPCGRGVQVEGRF